MGVNQRYGKNQDKILIQMQQAANGQWLVNQVGNTKPLGSFDDIEQCVDYASDIAKQKNAIIVQTLS